MRDLVDDGFAHDVGLASRRCGHPLDRSTKDEDAVGDVGLDRAPRGEGDTLVKTEQLAASPRLLLRGIVLDDDRDVAHALAELRRELVEGVAHESGEARAPEVGHCVAILGAGGRSPSTLVRPRTPGAPDAGPAPERGS